MGLFFSSWRNDVLTEAAKIENALGRCEPGAEDSSVKDVRDHIDAARKAAAANRGFNRIFAAWSGADIEAAWAELHAAKQALIFVARKEELRARIPELRSKVRRYLAKDDPSRAEYETWLTSATTSADDKLLKAQLHEIRVNVDWESDRKFKGIRRLRNLLLASVFAVALAVTGVALADESFGFLPLCPPPTETAPASTGDAATTGSGQATTLTRCRRGCRCGILPPGSTAHPPVKIEGFDASEQGDAQATVRAIIQEARRRDLLSKPPAGKAGGELTRSGLELLEALRH